MPKIYHRPTPGSLISIGADYGDNTRPLVLVLSVERSEFSRDYFVTVLGPDGQRATMLSCRTADEWAWGKRCKQRRISFLGDGGAGWKNDIREGWRKEHRWEEVAQ